MMRRRGFTVIEFVLASTLTLALVTTVSVASSTIQRSLVKNRVAAQLATVAANTFEKARAFSCGAEVSPRPPAAPTPDTDPSCDTQLFGGPVAGRGDGEWTVQVPTGSGNAKTPANATFSTNWRQANHTYINGSLQCGRSSSPSLTDTNQPSVLIRRITFTYELFGERYNTSFENSEAYPAVDIYQADRGGIIVRTKPSDLPLLKLQVRGGNNNEVLHRKSIPCGNVSDIVEVWFPYLSTGSYDLSGTTGILTANIQVTAGSVTVVNCQNERTCNLA
jgi:hypothetical protein